MAILHVTKDNFEEVIKEGTVLLDFWAPWCGPCRMLGPVLEQLDSEGLVKIGKINVDEEDELAAAFKISSIPALFLIKDGKKDRALDVVTVSGNLIDIFKDVLEVGNDERVFPSGVSCSSMMIKKIIVSGK